MNAFQTRRGVLPPVPCSRHAGMAQLAVAFAAVAAPFFGRGAAATGTPQTSTLETLAMIREDWVQDLRGKKLEPILNFYAADAAFLQPNGERITGAAALRALFQNIMAAFKSDLTLHSLKLEASGNLAYDSGEFEEMLTNNATGAKIESKGSYVIIYKRAANGGWRAGAWSGMARGAQCEVAEPAALPTVRRHGTRGAIAGTPR